MLRNIKLTVAYDGTDYHGFQEQRGTGLPTVQETLEQVLSQISGRPTQVIGAGRTDAGVHARGQVVNFDAAHWPIPVERIPAALNGRLPGDIVVTRAQQVADDFHARFGATAKIYHYHIWNHRLPSPFYRRYCYTVYPPLHTENMTTAASYLLGTHDFKSFQAAGSTVTNTIRTLYQSQVISQGSLLRLSFKGNGFLYNMVRIMVGTLLYVGLGKLTPEQVPQIISSRHRSRAGMTVPPQGLFLEQVFY